MSLNSKADALARTDAMAGANGHNPPQLSGAEIIVRALERNGVSVVAGIPGGALLPLYEALARCSRIRHILARHEQAAGFIAQGIARITHRAGVCLATSGPGVTNMITALADAKLDSIPLVCITGQVPTHLIGTDAFQEVATVELAKSVTKAAFLAASVDDLGNLIDEAFGIAENGRPGPVLIDVPKDVQLQRTVKSTARLRNEQRRYVHSRPQRCDLALDEAVALIAAAQRPMLYIGGGVIKARAEHLLQRFAEQTSIPVVTTLMALGALPYDHVLNLGMLGMHGSRATHQALDQCDLLIAIGARFDDRATGDPKRFAPHAKIIHADIDAREFGKIKMPTVSIHADAWTVLNQLVQRVPFGKCPEWLTWVKQGQVSCSSHEHDVRHPLSIIRAAGSRLPSDAIVTTDVGQHQMWVAQAYPFARADRWLTSGGLGTMGFGLPAAIGAAIAEPEATTVCFTGDGSLLMNIQELATLAELQLPVKIVLFDNASLGMVRQQQQLFYERRYFAANFERVCDFVGIARAFGIDAVDLDFTDDIAAQLSRVFLSRAPALVRVAIGNHYNVSPMVGPGAANIEAMDCE
jgi:acetolactate synthase-1/2/3 large subunit